MKHKFQIATLLLGLTGTAIAQIAPHALNASANLTPARSETAVSGKAVVRVNGVVLTDHDLLREEYAIFPYAKQHGGGIPHDMEPTIRNGALQMIIFEELVYQDARKRGLAVSAERISRAQADFRKQFDSPTAYQQFLQTEFQGNERLLRDRIARSLLIERLLKAEVHDKSAVTVAELKAYYEKNPARFQYPESFAIQTISVIPPANATSAQLKEARKRADESLKQAKATKTAEEFGLLAEKISDDDYHVMLGDHKWVERSKMPPQMLEPALKMWPGQMSGLIQVEGNYVIFRMNRHIAAGKLKFEEVSGVLRNELEKQKTDKVRSQLDKRLREKAKIESL